MVDIISTINTIFALMHSKGSAFTTMFVPDGFDLLMALGVIVAVWHGFLALLDGDFPNFYANLFRHMVKCAILMAILTGWSSTVHTYIVGGMQQMADRITGGDSSITNVATIGLSAISTLVNGPRKQATAPCETVPSTTPDGQIIPGVTQQDCSGGAAVGAGASNSLSAIGYLLKNLPLVILTVLLKGIAILCIALMILFYMIFVQMGSLLLDVAFLVGPVLIPWYVLSAMDFLFDSWLRFTISAGLYKVIAAAMMVFTSAIVPGMQTFMASVATTNGVAGDEYYATSYLASIGLAIVCGLGAFMMWQVPDIAGRLTGGGTGASSRGLIGSTMRLIPGLR